MVRRVDRFNPADRRPEQLGLGVAVWIAILSWVILTSFCSASCSKQGAAGRVVEQAEFSAGGDRAGSDLQATLATLTLPVQGTPEISDSNYLDFQKRCKSPGVLRCVGFDSPPDFVPAVWPHSGLYPKMSDKQFKGTMDTSVKASGGGSLRFEIDGRTSGDAAGRWIQDFGQSFGEGSTFYVQFRQRFSPEMLKVHFAEMGGAWKQVIFHHGDVTCADVELTTHQRYDLGLPEMYTDCGGRGLWTHGGDPPYLVQQGDYNCNFGKYVARDCFFYTANRWITFYYQVSIGNWGTASSTIKAWVAVDGKPYKQWINMPKFVLYNGTPGNDYDHLTLTAYMTGKDPTINHPTAYTWYDELILSTQPIAAPNN